MAAFFICEVGHRQLNKAMAVCAYQLMDVDMKNKRVKAMMVDVATNFRPFCIHERIHPMGYHFHNYCGLKIVGGVTVNYREVSLTANQLKGIEQ